MSKADFYLEKPFQFKVSRILLSVDLRYWHLQVFWVVNTFLALLRGSKYFGLSRGFEKESWMRACSLICSKCLACVCFLISLLLHHFGPFLSLIAAQEQQLGGSLSWPLEQVSPKWVLFWGEHGGGQGKCVHCILVVSSLWKKDKFLDLGEE